MKSEQPEHHISGDRNADYGPSALGIFLEKRDNAYNKSAKEEDIRNII